MKTDARVKYTKMVLKKALLELMQHKPVNKNHRQGDLRTSRTEPRDLLRPLFRLL